MRIIVVLVFCLAVIFEVTPAAQRGRSRHIPFGGTRPIIEQLEPGDRVVTLTPPRIDDSFEQTTATLEEALQELKTLPEVVVFKVIQSQSFLVRNGTWVRTRVTASVENALRHSASIPWGEGKSRLVLESDDGEIELKGVTVKAGRYPLLKPGARYLGLLAYEGHGNSWYLGRGYEIDTDNKLQRLKNWDGTAHSFESPLEGVPLETVIQLFKN